MVYVSDKPLMQSAFRAYLVERKRQCLYEAKNIEKMIAELDNPTPRMTITTTPVDKTSQRS